MKILVINSIIYQLFVVEVSNTDLSAKIFRVCNILQESGKNVISDHKVEPRIQFGASITFKFDLNPSCGASIIPTLIFASPEIPTWVFQNIYTKLGENMLQNSEVNLECLILQNWWTVLSDFFA